MVCVGRDHPHTRKNEDVSFSWKLGRMVNNQGTFVIEKNNTIPQRMKLQILGMLDTLDSFQLLHILCCNHPKGIYNTMLQ